jgi:drug/metabolite transporter (DMT)-like permease
MTTTTMAPWSSLGRLFRLLGVDASNNPTPRPDAKEKVVSSKPETMRGDGAFWIAAAAFAQPNRQQWHRPALLSCSSSSSKQHRTHGRRRRTRPPVVPSSLRRLQVGRGSDIGAGTTTTNATTLADEAQEPIIDPPPLSVPDDTDRSSSSLLLGLSPIVWLNGVAILWGSQHAVIKTILMNNDDMINHDSQNGPANLLLLRFGLAALLALASKLLPTRRMPEEDEELLPETTELLSTEAAAAAAVGTMEENNHHGEQLSSFSFLSIDASTWRWGIELGIYMFLGFLFQAIGLQYTTAQKSAFLLYLNVKFVPFLGLLLYGRPITTLTFTSALAAFVGTTLLATGSSSSTTIIDESSLSSAAAASAASSWNVGDAWTMAAAAASAMFILRLEKATTTTTTTSHHNANDEEKTTQNVVPSAVDLNAASLVVVTILSGLWSLLSTTALPMWPDNGDAATTGAMATSSSSSLWTMASTFPIQLLYLGGITTALSNWIQTRAQKYVPAERAALIYSLDPVYGAIFSYLLLHERLESAAAVVGAGLITVAAATNAYLELFATKEKPYVVAAVVVTAQKEKDS